MYFFVIKRKRNNSALYDMQNLIVFTGGISMIELYNDNVNIVEISETEWDTFSVHVKTKKFSGKHNFCIEWNFLSQKIKDLENLIEQLCGECVIEDMDSDSYLNFSMKKYGKMTFSGRLGGTHTNNYMVFEFMADQTIVQNLIVFLKTLDKSEAVH